jgi:PAS domain S-box-containing protein
VATLREREARLQLALDVAQLGTWSWDLTTGTGDLDARGAAIVGLPPGPIADIAAAQRAATHPDDLAHLETAVAAGIASGAAFDLHYRVIHPDGSVHHVASRARLVTDAAGRPLQLVGTTRDVTAERVSATRQAFLLQLADALRPLSDPLAIQREASRTLRAYLGAGSVAYWEVVGDTTVATAEDVLPGIPSFLGQHYRFIDYGPVQDEYLAGRLTWRTDVAADGAFTPAQKAAYAASKVNAWAVAPLVKDGVLLALLAAYFPSVHTWTPDELALLEETAERTWAAVERARAEAALRESEALLQTAVSIDTVGVLFFRLDGRMTDANAAFERMSGFSRTELLTTVHWEVLTPPEFRDVTTRAAAELAARGETAPYEKQLIRKDGARWWGLFAPTRLSGSGRDAHCVEFILDITARKQAEAAVARALVAEQAARAEAEAALATRDQFLAIATHELRTPLTGLVGYAELLQRKSQAGRLDAAAGRRIADVVVRQARQLNRLVEQLFDVSRIARGFLELECHPLDLGALVAHVTAEVRLGLPEETQRRIAVTRPLEPLLVHGDAARLEQVVRNLLSNAVKYSPHGGPIGISVARHGHTVALAVTDAGIGIPAVALAQLYESFYRAHNVGSIRGFGIGLHVVQAIVERHGGRIEVASVEGHGSTFRVTLPLAAAPA